MSDSKEFPWTKLVPPETGYRSILVDADSPWNFFWARKKGSGPSLLLRTNQKFETYGRDLKGIDLEVIADGNSFLLAITLTDELDADVFEYFCERLVSSCARSLTETEVVSRLLLEIERWHDFLGRIRAGMTLEQRMGLFGELIFLERLLEINSPKNVIGAWFGPFGGSRDFQFGNVEIEVKAVSKNQSRIRIASEFQLDDQECDQMFLKVFTLCDSDQGRSILDVATAVLQNLDPMSQLEFQSRLDSVGAVYLSRLDRDNWVVCGESTFKVTADFPALKHSEISTAISSVQYRLNLSSLEKFGYTNETLLSKLAGESNG